MTKKLNEVKGFIPCCYDQFSSKERELVINISKALGNEARLEIYTYLLNINTCYTGQLVDHLPLAQSTISQHLKVLQEAGVIIGSIEGKSTYYCINHDNMRMYHQLLGQLIKA